MDNKKENLRRDGLILSENGEIVYVDTKTKKWPRSGGKIKVAFEGSDGHLSRNKHVVFPEGSDAVILYFPEQNEEEGTKYIEEFEDGYLRDKIVKYPGAPTKRYIFLCTMDNHLSYSDSGIIRLIHDMAKRF